MKIYKSGVTMKVFFIIIKEMKESFRDLRSLIILFIMPLLLSSILSVTFKDKLSTNVDFSGTTVFYTFNCTEEETTVMNQYIIFLKDLGFQTKEATTSHKEGIQLYFNSLSNIKIEAENKYSSQVKILHALMDTFSKRYNTLQNIASSSFLSPETIQELQRENYVIEKSLVDFKSPSSKDYYGIVILTLSFMFTSVLGAYKVQAERKSGTLVKLSSMPISKNSMLLGKLLGTSLFLFLEGSLILYISNRFLGVYMGDNLLPILLALSSEITLAVSFGIFIGYTISDTQSALLLLVITVIIMGFLGGSFVPLSNLNSDFIYRLSSLSPLTYVNNSIFNYIYNKNIAMLYDTSLLNIVISSILLIITNAVMEVRK